MTYVFGSDDIEIVSFYNVRPVKKNLDLNSSPSGHFFSHLRCVRKDLPVSNSVNKNNELQFRSQPIVKRKFHGVSIGVA